MPLHPEDLPRDVDKLVELAVRLSTENDHLREMVKSVNGFAFGARSERGEAIVAGQGLLDLGDLETDVVEAANDDEPVAGAASTRKPAKRNIGALPRHLERVERIIEPSTVDCPCCAGALHRIGEDASEAFDWVPSILRVIRTVRPRYACRQCQSAIVQAPAPKRMIEGGMTTTSTIAWIATARFAWSIPLNRQLQMLAGQGLVLDRSLFSGWMKRAAWWLEGLYKLQMRIIHSQPRIFVDETRMPVLEKDGKRSGYRNSGLTRAMTGRGTGQHPRQSATSSPKDEAIWRSGNSSPNIRGCCRSTAMQPTSRWRKRVASCARYSSLFASRMRGGNSSTSTR